ncbi:MAG: type I DNA topoisomerase [Candidatus Hydrogenedentales bacterium]|jgi:DNA topoisomerase-1
MEKCLVVVESPAKAKTINRFLGNKYVVRASYGHVRDLPKNDLGVDIDNNFQPKYVTLKDSQKAVKALLEAASKVDLILLASDPDREGEAIGWHVAELLKKSKKPVQRIVFNEITKRSVREATQHPRELDLNLVNAQQARRVLDRLVGYKISPLLQWTMKKGLSAGRVQSVAVRMVCEREAEIRAFVTVEYWTLDALLETERNTTFTARLAKIRGEKAEIGNEAQIKDILNRLEGVPFQVSSVEKKEVRRRPYPPFITSSLQQEASRKLGFSPRKTMVLAQQLYEGLELGPDGHDGLITYMRTDSTRIAAEALEEVRTYIRDNHPPAMLPEKPNFYATKKGAQDAHEAIRPTVPSRTPEKVAAYLDAEQLKLYTLIWMRFVASQMAPAVLDQTTVDIEAGEFGFRASGSVMKFPGFTSLYEETQEDKTNGKDGEEASGLLPELNQNDKLAVQDLKPEQHFTKPPPRFSEASLIRALEENGIGRPSTFAPTINTIMDRGYVEREKGRLTPTELGERVNEALVRDFPDILDISFTAQLEADLDHVEEGTREWHDLIRDFYVSFAKDLTSAQNRVIKERLGEDAACPKCGGTLEVAEGFFGLYMRCATFPKCDGRVSLKRTEAAEPTDEICDKCGSPMVIRAGRFGKFMACSTYPTCKNTHNVDKQGNKIDAPPKEPPKETDQKCPTCGSMILIRRSRMGEEFYGCSAYPKCKFTRPMELGLTCPRAGCGGNLVPKLANRRRFIGCDKYPACDFTAFGKIDKAVACEKCGNPWTTVIKSKSKPTVRKCPVPACAFEVELPGEDV